MKVRLGKYLPLLLATLFIFSGFVKAVDPLGSFYKIQDYLTAFGIISWFPTFCRYFCHHSVIGRVLCRSFPVFGIRRKIASTLGLFLMGVMTPLTLYLAFSNPVSDCGCFGDAWVLTNWQTFGKNIIVDCGDSGIPGAEISDPLYRYAEMEWMVSLYTLLFVFALSFIVWNIFDIGFPPYKIGADIKAGMEIPKVRNPVYLRAVCIGERRKQDFIG